MKIIKKSLFVVAAVASVMAMAANDFDQSDSAAAIASKQSVPVTVSKKSPVIADKEKAIKSLSLLGLDGVNHSLAEWSGKVVLLNFWATWCSPCIYEIRDFVAFQELYKVRGLQIIGVGMDEEYKLRNVQRTLEINYPVLVADPVKNSGLMTRWGNSSGVVPYTVVIDREGRVVYTHHGLMSRDEFDEFVLPLLEKI